jgi:hypothetical protein
MSTENECEVNNASNQSSLTPTLRLRLPNNHRRIVNLILKTMTFGVTRLGSSPFERPAAPTRSRLRGNIYTYTRAVRISMKDSEPMNHMSHVTVHDELRVNARPSPSTSLKALCVIASSCAGAATPCLRRSCDSLGYVKDRKPPTEPMISDSGPTPILGQPQSPAVLTGRFD